jgi:hypothetical protein
VLYETELGAQQIISGIESRLRELRTARDDVETPARQLDNETNDVEPDETQDPE